jgi:hypothetical protein
MVAKEEDLRGVETMFRDECVVMVDIFLKDRLECATRKIAAGLGLQKVRAACDEVLNVVKFRRVWVRRESMLQLEFGRLFSGPQSRENPINALV